MDDHASILAVSRREFKYLLSLTDRLFLLDALDRLLIPDTYGGCNGYGVRSVYFDSIANRDYWDKRMCAEEKKRLRLRICDPESQPAKFEMKRNTAGGKQKRASSFHGKMPCGC
jgi:hypothetical protein